MSSPATHPSPLEPSQVADLLETLAVAELQLARVIDRICASRWPVSRATVVALERLLVILRPAVEVRARLAAVDRGVLAAGIRVRRERRDGLRVVSGELQ